MRILESIINNSISNRIRSTAPVARGKVLTKLRRTQVAYEYICTLLLDSVVYCTRLNKGDPELWFIRCKRHSWGKLGSG
jgi:hypothetical protein